VVSLPACATVLLLATTNKLCQDVAVIPFLWILPLALYLFRLFCVLIIRAGTCGLVQFFAAARWRRFVGRCFAALIWNCAPNRHLSGGTVRRLHVCHGELYRLKPHPRHLTSFYLMLAAGGALGGVLVALVAPLVFNSYFEFHLGVWACAVLLLWICLREKSFAIAAGIGAGACALP